MIYIDGVLEEFSGDLNDYMDRNIHRVDGPAIIWGDGREDWYLNGELHRVDGPAIIWGNGDKEWYLTGEWYSFEEFLRMLPEEDAVMVKLTWG